jgi:hypothetical protein
MFDFRKFVRRRHSIIAAHLHDEFNADHGDNNHVLVTSAGARIAGLNHSSSSRQPVQRSLVSASGVTAAPNEGFAKPRKRRSHKTTSNALRGLN